MFDKEDIQDAQKSPVLGPAYFDARRVSQNLMEKFDAEQFEPLIKKASDEFYNSLREHVETYLLSDTECNIQGEMYRMVDNCVKGLLSGEQWALQRYVLTGRFDGEKIRRAILALIPEELKDARISDLEKEAESLRKDLAYYKNRERY